jgi:thioredoxin 1
MIVRDSIVLYAQPGALPESALEQLIAKAKELDMDEVRASVTAPENTAPQESEDTAPAEA